jgi:predicted phosphodiesterase
MSSTKLVPRDEGKVAWLTDIHLEFCKPSEVISFCQEVVAAQPDVVLIGGDIGVASTLADLLATLAQHIERPIYFVLGNHDFYGGSITQIRHIMPQIARQSPWLNWLPASGIVELSQSTALIGHGAYADGRLGDGIRSQVQLNDYFYIEEFIGLPQIDRFAKLNALGDEAANYFRTLLPQALARYPKLLLLTHVPPFREACWHEGRLSDDDFLPHFSCQAVGEVLREIMQAHPQCQMTVLCGHTHGAGEAHILPNLQVKTGGTTYGQPEIQEMILVA